MRFSISRTGHRSVDPHPINLDHNSGGDMLWDEAWKLVRNTLAALYPDSQSMRRVIESAGFPSIQFNFSGRPIDVWHALLTDVVNRDPAAGLRKILEVAN